jgi:hypothetical protein
MADLPTHPDTDDPSGQEPDRAGTAGGPRRGAMAGIALATVLVVLVVLHLTGVVGPGSH